MPSRVGADEVGLELRDHAQDVEQQLADGVGWVVGASAQRQNDAGAGELVGDVPGV